MGTGEGRVRAQLQGGASGRRSKYIKDPERIEAMVEVAGLGRFTLSIESGGSYSLRAWPEEADDPGRDLIAVGVMRADGVVAVDPHVRYAGYPPGQEKPG